MNKDLLFQLYEIHSPSGSEKKMRRFIKRYVASNCGDCKVEQDVHGNLFITKGVSDTYPCLAAHMDQVQSFHSKDFTVVEINGDVIGWSPKCHKQQGLGADDKNGIFICLEILRDVKVLKVAFFVGEEVGCKGSNACDLGFFKDCRFIIQPDRKGSSDLITSMFCGDVCSEEFVKALNAEAYGYEEDQGSVTDVGELVERGVGISCLNLSCGYYDAHTDHEYTVLGELENCLEFVQDIVEFVTDVYPYEYEGRSYGYFGGRYGSKLDFYDYDYNYGYNYWGGKKKDKWQDDEYWDMYECDFGEMQKILESQPDLTFEEVLADWHMNFFIKDSDLLRDIYEDARECVMYDRDNDVSVFENEPEEEAEGTEDEKSGLEVTLNSFKGFIKKVS